MKKIFLLVFMGLTAFIWAGNSELETMPDFTLQNTAGKDVNLYESLNDSTVVIVDFWATWCGPCVKALPHLDSLHNKYDNLQVFAVTTDGRRTLQKAKDYIKEKGYTFTVLMDSNREVQRLLNIQAIPETFIITPSRKIHYRHIGYKPGDEVKLEDKVKELLIEMELE